MKVILLQDVARIGKRFEIKEVPAGHARNFLIPRKLVEAATPKNVKRVQARNNQKDKEAEGVQETFLKTRALLKDTEVTLSVPANEQGHLFEGLKANAIATHVSKEVGTLTSEQIELPKPIKEVGEHSITITSGSDTGILKLLVTGT